MSRYALTVVLSAFLLFLVQPLMGKVVLPWFGGSASVWTACLLFFQLLLLGGYAWSHLVVRRLNGVWQRRAHLLLLLCASLALIITAVSWGAPLAPPSSLRPSGTTAPLAQLLVLLLLAVGLPYFTLSSTGPLLQAWVAQRLPTATAMRLYAVSNIGSLLGLVCFPVLLEPFFTLRVLTWAWATGFLVFAAACASLAWRAPIVARDEGSEEKLPRSRIAAWVVLAACPSALLLAVTQHVTQDVAPIPFLWVLPLALYLGSFIITFDNSRWYRRGWALPALWVTGLLSAILLQFTFEDSVKAGLVGHGGFLFMACLTGHGELVRLKPSSSALTAFYLSVSAGGALGGVLVALVAPLVFADMWDLPLLGAFTVAAVAVAVAVSEGPTRFGKTVMAISVLVSVMFCWPLTESHFKPTASWRNFYGALRVFDEKEHRELLHGRIIHGEQYFARPRETTSYYSTDSGVGRWLTAQQRPLNVGVIGLGIGTLAAYAQPGDTYRFYELNPLMEDIARGPYFSFLRDAQGTHEIVLGDGRTSLENEAPNAFDLLVVDAFAGDAIPVHLLSFEALKLYLHHIKDDGVIALHVSNRYINLLPVAARLAVEAKLHSLGIDTRRSVWVLLSQQPIVLDVPDDNRLEMARWERGPLWTDEFSSLWGLLKR